MTLTRWIAAETVMHGFADDRDDVIWLDAGSDGDALGASPREGHPHRSMIGWGDRVLRGWAGEPGTLDAAWDVVASSVSEWAGRQDAAPLGWWGWIGYGAGAELLAPGDASWARALGDPAHPDLALLEVDRALVFDHDTGTVQLMLVGEQDEHAEWVERLRSWWYGADVAALASPETPATRQAVWADEPGHYLELIGRCQDAIREGRAFVMCLTTSVRVDDVPDDDLTLYRRLRRWSPAPRAMFMRLDGASLLSSTPETFLTLGRDGLVVTQPIKGTRPRGADPLSDLALADALAGSSKERGENLMIVDLMRNDLSRVAVPGGVEVTELFGVHTYEHVHQLISTIRGRLRPGLTAVDVVRAIFPPGSMTGAPKHSVVSLLADWEAAPRGVYSGAAGRFGLDGSLDLSVVIRSIVLDRTARTATVGVGGGITASSVPGEELDEVRTKAAALLAVLGAAPIAAPAGSGATGDAAARAARVGPTPRSSVL